jgi:hypothetical protein
VDAGVVAAAEVEIEVEVVAVEVVAVVVVAEVDWYMLMAQVPLSPLVSCHSIQKHSPASRSLST